MLLAPTICSLVGRIVEDEEVSRKLCKSAVLISFADVSDFAVWLNIKAPVIVPAVIFIVVKFATGSSRASLEWRRAREGDIAAFSCFNGTVSLVVGDSDMGLSATSLERGGD